MALSDIKQNGLVFGQTLGSGVTDATTGINFVINLIIWLGWAMVIFGAFLIVTKLIFDLINKDGSKLYESVNLKVTQMVMLIVVGIIFLGSGFLIGRFAGLFGQDVNFNSEGGSTNGDNTGGNNISTQCSDNAPICPGITTLTCTNGVWDCANASTLQCSGNPPLCLGGMTLVCNNGNWLCIFLGSR